MYSATTIPRSLNKYVCELLWKKLHPSQRRLNKKNWQRYRDNDRAESNISNYNETENEDKKSSSPC